MTDFAAYVLYVNRPDLLQRAIEGLPQLAADLTIIDNSEVDNGDLKGLGITVYRPPVPFTYSQSMNWMLKTATSRGKDFIINFHSDATNSNPEAANELLARCREERDKGTSWGCLWTFYDILWAINPVALNDIGGWDTNFHAYFTDQDTRRRLHMANWETIDTHIQGLDHEGSSVIKSDRKLEYLNGVTFPLFRHYYLAKWGGQPGHERFTVPFNVPDLFGK